MASIPEPGGKTGPRTPQPTGLRPTWVPVQDRDRSQEGKKLCPNITLAMGGDSVSHLENVALLWNHIHIQGIYCRPSHGLGTVILLSNQPWLCCPETSQAGDYGLFNRRMWCGIIPTRAVTFPGSWFFYLYNGKINITHFKENH